MKKALTAIIFSVLFFSLAMVLAAQSKKNPKKPARSAPAAATATPQPTPEAAQVVPPKKNERPGGDTTEPVKNNRSRPASGEKPYTPVYFYEFARPGFTYSRILIDHDDTGRGRISLQRDGYDDLLTDPIDISQATLAKIKGALASLNFLDSTESYQYADHDFSNMGNVTLTVKQGGRERTVKYNWTTNKDAKLLMDEYRRIGNEFTWKFEISTARVNQPLLTPGMMDEIDNYLQRDEISDPEHLLPFLTELSTDERLPLMGRNRALKLIKQIEKKKK